jgi:hypothetical protein
MASHRIYQYSSIGRPLDPAYPTNRAVLSLLPVAALAGAVLALLQGESALEVLSRAMIFLLAAFGSWALARELDPDDHPAAFISMAVGLLAASLVQDPGILVMFVTLGLARIVNRSTGLVARKVDSIVLMALSIWLMYRSDSPLFGIVAALAFILDGSLSEPLRRQWLFALICLAGSVVYMVDHTQWIQGYGAPNSLFEWLSLLFLLIFALDTMLLKRVRSAGDFNGAPLDVARVRGGMAIGFFAALQGINRPDSVVLIVATIAGICLGMAFRKGFKAPASARSVK